MERHGNRRPAAVGASGTTSLRIPRKFRSLLPLARTWAVHDDSERCEFLASSSPHSKRAMVSAVFPHFEELETWIAVEKAGLSTHCEVRDLELLLAAATEVVFDIYLDS